MPNNGAAVHLASEPISAPVIAPNPATALELEIGTAVASAAEAVALSIVDYAAIGAMRAETRALNGARLGAVAMIWLDHFGEIDDFRGLALHAGRRVLRDRHAGAMRQHFGAAGEATLDRMLELVDHVIVIATQVVAGERALRQAWAN